jgi:hypothetical protein
MDIPGFENYTIDESGNVYSKLSERMLKPKIICGYLFVVLTGKKTRTIHRLVALTYIANPEDKLCVDHIDGNRVNNHMSNLRWATRAENGANCKKRSDNTSGFKGVNFHKPTNKWRASIQFQSKKQHIGYFDSAEEASEAYKLKAAELFGKFVRSE